MSTFPDSSIPAPIACPAPGVSPWKLSRSQFAGVATVFAALGLSTIWPAILTLWTYWTTDALKSIGMVIPLVSLILILRVWRTFGWEAKGTWWGLVLVLFTMTVVWIQRRAVLIMVISPHWSTALPPPSLVLLAYGSGAVLLLGGAATLSSSTISNSPLVVRKPCTTRV